MRAILLPSSAPGHRPGSPAGGLFLGLILGIGLFPAGVRAAGSLIEAQSPAGVGLAGAMSARADDASAIYYNPAGLGFQSGLSVVAGVSLLLPHQSASQASDPNAYTAKSNLFVLPTIYAAARVSDQLAIGLGVFVNQGGGANWNNPDDTRAFPGRYLALRTQIQSFTFNPTITIRVVPEVSVGGGVDIQLGSLDSARNLSLGSADGTIELAGSSIAVGGNIGALARLLDGRLNFGLTFRSALTMHFKDMQVGVTAPPGVYLASPFTQGATDIPAPHVLTVGVAGKPARFLTISVDAISSLWSSVHQQYIVLSDGMSQTQTSTIPRNWKDAYSGRIGIELDVGQVLPPSTKFWPKVRLGFGYDQSPVPVATLDPSVPDADRFFPSVGLSLGYRGLGSLELGYQAVFFRSQTSENPNLALTYDTMIHVFSVALNLQLERVLGKRSPGFDGRLLDRSPEPPPENLTSTATP